MLWEEGLRRRRRGINKMAYRGFLELVSQEHRQVELGRSVETAFLEQLLVEEAQKIGYTLQDTDAGTNCHGLGERYFFFRRFFFPPLIVSLENKPDNSYVHVCNGRAVSRPGFKEKVEEYKKRVLTRCEK